MLFVVLLIHSFSVLVGCCHDGDCQACFLR